VAGRNTGITAFSQDVPSGTTNSVVFNKSEFGETAFEVHLESATVVDTLTVYYDDGECGSILLSISGTASDESDLSHGCQGGSNCQDGFSCEGGNETGQTDDDVTGDDDDDNDDDTETGENHAPEVVFMGINKITGAPLDTPFVLGQNCIYYHLRYQIIDEDDNLNGGGLYVNLDGGGWNVAQSFDYGYRNGTEVEWEMEVDDWSVSSHTIELMVRDALDAASNEISVEFEVVEVADCSSVL
jgi:hypothetical protein